MLAPADAAVAVGQGFNLNPSDLAFILKQIKIAEHHAANYDAAAPLRRADGAGRVPDPHLRPGEELPWGLRTVDGTCNNLVPGQRKFGSADQTFPRARDRTSAGRAGTAEFPGNALSPRATRRTRAPATWSTPSRAGSAT